MEDETSQEAATLRQIEERVERAFAEDPHFKQRSLTALNSEAVECFKRGDYEAVIVAYAKIFRRVREDNVTHSGLHVCYGNRSAAWRHLGLYTQALQDAEQSRALAEISIQRSGMFCRSYVKAYLRKGEALLAMGRVREASTVLNDGLKIDPVNPELRAASERATRELLAELVDGRPPLFVESANEDWNRERNRNLVSATRDAVRENLESRLRHAAAQNQDRGAIADETPDATAS